MTVLLMRSAARCSYGYQFFYSPTTSLPRPSALRTAYSVGREGGEFVFWAASKLLIREDLRQAKVNGGFYVWWGHIGAWMGYKVGG